jgi:hypothetical protein
MIISAVGATSHPTADRLRKPHSMKIAKKLTVCISLAGALGMLAGCSHQKATVAADDYSWMSNGQAEDQFLSDVENLPPDQRKDYVLDHRDQLNQLQMDPDKSKLKKLDTLLPPEIP